MKTTGSKLLAFGGHDFSLARSSSRHSLLGRSSRVLALGATLSLFTACAPKGAPGPAHPAVTSDAEWSERTEALRPPSASLALEALDRAPKDPTTYALLADAYVESDAPVMSLFYGLYYRAMGTDCASDRLASLAIGRVLAQKIAIVEESPGKFSYDSRLAESEVTPRRLEGGKVAPPLANVSARSIEAALPGFTGQGGLAEFSALLGRWVEGNEAIGALGEFRTYLREVKKAGHLEVFAYLALGLAFEDEFKKYASSHEDTLKAGLAYLDQHLFVPSTPPRADDAVL